jgi:hypothetical protein
LADALEANRGRLKRAATVENLEGQKRADSVAQASALAASGLVAGRVYRLDVRELTAGLNSVRSIESAIAL